MKIRAEVSDGVVETSLRSGLTLLDHLREAGVFVNAACGGKGSCQKCRVQLREGFLGITSSDRQAFRPQELEQGWRLSCQSRPKTKCTIKVPETESFKAKPRLIKTGLRPNLDSPLVCDLGSTGMVVSVPSTEGKIALESHLLNRQVKFGSDVMTRLNVAQHQGVEPLQNSLFESLNFLVQTLNKDAEIATEGKTIYCSGNSAMVSFLQGWDITTLAVSPYQPVATHSQTVNSETQKSFQFISTLKIKTLPLLGGFVGADTFAGILYLEQTLKAPRPWMLVDIGTNTEIVLCDEAGKLWFCSAPAGPAFEGGNISQGMRAEPGAISVAHYKSGWTLETIGGDRARGICGSGLIDLLAEASTHGLMNPDGYLSEGSLRITDEISLLADDVREFQLAKSATRSACELLIDRAKTTPNAIYLAGTFAQHLRLESVDVVGLLPKKIPVKQIGNSSLFGTLVWSQMSDHEQEKMENDIRQRSEQIELALQDEFQDIFVRNLDFGGK